MVTKKRTKSEPISLYPLKFEEVVRGVLATAPPKKQKRQRSGKRRDRKR